jgi:hypothetical protein
MQKKTYIENAVIYCIRIPLSQLITVDCTIQEGMFNIVYGVIVL